MATLIAVYDSDGLVGRCDAKCYNASSPGCECICGGKNHGAGVQQAIDNTRALADAWLKQYTEDRGLASWRAEVPAREPVQLSFFTED